MNGSGQHMDTDPGQPLNSTVIEEIPDFLAQKIVQQIFYAVIFVLSLLGNAAMLAVSCKGFRSGRRPSNKNILLVNMIVAETAVALTSIPFDFAMMFINSGWVFGSVMCHVLWPLQTAPFGALVLTLTAMSVQRYKGIVHHLRRRKAGRQSSYTTVGFIWAFSIIIVVPYGVFLRLENGACIETWGTIGGEIYTLGLFAFHYAIPLSIITFCYARIALAIRRGHHEGESIISGTRQARLNRSKRHVRAVRMVVLFVVVFAVCMLPHQVVWLWITFGKDVHYNDDLLTFAYMFTFTSSFANPLVYFTYNPALRARLKVLLFCRSAPEGRFRSTSLLQSDDTGSADSRV